MLYVSKVKDALISIIVR